MACSKFNKFIKNMNDNFEIDGELIFENLYGISMLDVTRIDNLIHESICFNNSLIIKYVFPIIKKFVSNQNKCRSHVLYSYSKTSEIEIFGIDKCREHLSLSVKYKRDCIF